MESIFELKQDLYCNGLKQIPDSNGYYIVYKPDDFNIGIKDTSDAISSYVKDGQAKNLLYPREKLIKKIAALKDINILYIGKAERIGGLRARITEFINYGYRLCNNHRGGRAIWQIENNKSLLLNYVVTENPEEKEKEFLIEFKKVNGQYPFANWKL